MPKGFGGNPKTMCILVENIRTYLYRSRYEDEKETLEELCDQIKQHGLLQPIVVRQIGADEYELVAGIRRLQACDMAGLQEVPAVVIEVDDTIGDMATSWNDKPF